MSVAVTHDRTATMVPDKATRAALKRLSDALGSLRYRAARRC